MLRTEECFFPSPPLPPKNKRHNKSFKVFFEFTGNIREVDCRRRFAKMSTDVFFLLRTNFEEVTFFSPFSFLGRISPSDLLKKCPKERNIPLKKSHTRRFFLLSDKIYSNCNAIRRKKKRDGGEGGLDLFLGTI